MSSGYKIHGVTHGYIAGRTTLLACLLVRSFAPSSRAYETAIFRGIQIKGKQRAPPPPRERADTDVNPEKKKRRKGQRDHIDAFRSPDSSGFERRAIDECAKIKKKKAGEAKNEE